MANAKNTAAVAELKKRFEETNAIVLTEYRGLTVAQTTELRRKLGADVQYSVAKNTMIKLAAREAGVEGLDDLLSGPTAVAFIKGEAVDAAQPCLTLTLLSLHVFSLRTRKNCRTHKSFSARMTRHAYTLLYPINLKGLPPWLNLPPKSSLKLSRK